MKNYSRQFMALLVLALLSSLANEISSEQLTLTTYYPSPAGYYTKLGSTSDTVLATTSGGVSIGSPNPPPSGIRLYVNGKVGINTNSPTEMLQVNGKIKMTDGNQALNKVLTSDANGVGTWQLPTPTYEISCVSGVNTGGTTRMFNSCCRLITSTGQVTCKVAGDWLMNSWGVSKTAFAASTADVYRFTYSMGVDTFTFPFVCRTRSSTGVTECARALDWALNNWTATTNPF